MWVTKDLILRTPSLKSLIASCRSTTIWRQRTHPWKMAQLNKSITIFRSFSRPLIQSLSNHLPSPSRANYVPFKIMTGLDAFSPQSILFDPDANKIRDSGDEVLKECARDLKKSLDKLHKKVETLVKSSRAPKSRNVKKQRSSLKLDRRDNVVVAVAEPQDLSKLQPGWMVPTQWLT